MLESGLNGIRPTCINFGAEVEANSDPLHCSCRSLIDVLQVYLLSTRVTGVRIRAHADFFFFVA